MGKPVIGLVGGIGSGKSRVAAAFAARGGKVISGDAAGHEALRQPEIRERVVRRWGQQVLDEKGEIDRRAVARVVFADPAELRALEEIVHPWIGRRLREEIAAAQSDPAVPFVVLDAAVMLEAGWNNVCDKLVYVDAPRAERLRRLAAQRGWTEKEVAARESNQLPRSEKITRADCVVDNSGPPEAAARQVDDLLRRWGLLR
ncbi:MAG TPA: dephospho-CoA kinase [Gemmataceae bacterium]|nr:dephospho-CoA kinase [Gemmataceae bacterium]